MVFDFRYCLKGERIILRRYKPTIKLAKIIFSVVDSNREHLRKWFHFEKKTLKVEDTLRYVFGVQQKYQEKKEAVYGIYLEDEYIGNISVFDIDEKNSSGEIGFWMSSEYTNKGYMQEAIHLLEKQAFKKAGINRLQIRCDEENQKSFNLAKKCGYKLEGIARELQYNEHFNDFRNIAVFSKLKSEY